MRRLTRREKTLVVLCTGLAALAGASLRMSPQGGATAEEALAYYVDTFTQAEAVTIRSASEEADPITVEREEATRLLSRLEMAVRYGAVSPHPSPYSPKWILDVSKRDGSKVENIEVGFHLKAPKQPGKGTLWVVPRLPGQREPEPVMVQIIDDYVDSLQAGSSAEKAE
jgi:hypothetical protein